MSENHVDNVMLQKLSQICFYKLVSKRIGFKFILFAIFFSAKFWLIIIILDNNSRQKENMDYNYNKLL